AEANTEILLNTLDPHQQEIENYFQVEGQKRFILLMKLYMKLFNSAKYAGTTIRDRLSIFPKRGPQVEATSSWDVGHFTRECIRVAGDRFLDNRSADLVRRLTIQAEESGFPSTLLGPRCEAVGKLDWRQRHESALRESLQAAEKVWTNPTGPRRWLQMGII